MMVKIERANTEMISMLRKQYSASENAKAIFDSFRSRQKNSNETKTDRLHKLLLQQDLDIDRAELIGFLRNLEKAGCGKYVEGRRGHPSRFEWRVELIDVGRAAAGDAERIEEIPAEGTGSEDGEGDMVPHEYRLRPGMVIRVELPEDLTTSEATRFAEFVKTLPFERASGT
jgi:hypothetical protein